MREMKKIFWSLAVVFVALVSYFVVPAQPELKRMFFPMVGVLGGVFMGLGGWMVYKTIKLKIKGEQRRWQLMMGGGAALFIPAVILHNLGSGLLTMALKREEVVEEPVFFLIAIVGCPIVFLIGMVGGMSLMARGKVGGKK